MGDLRFVHDAWRRVQEHETPETLEMEDGDDIVAMFHQVGMISTFTASDISDPLVKYLMLSDRERASAVKPMAELHAKARKERATGAFEPILDTAFFSRELFELFLPNSEPQAVTEPVLDDRVRELLGRFLDFMWSETASSESESERVDMRMSMPDELFLQLLGDKGQESSPRGGESSSSKAKDVLKKIYELWGWMDPNYYSGSLLLMLLHIYILCVYINTSSR